jgi:hypothetical protein
MTAPTTTTVPPDAAATRGPILPAAPDLLAFAEPRPPIEAGWCQLLGVVSTVVGVCGLAFGALAWLAEGPGPGAAGVGAGLAVLAIGAVLMATGAALREQVRQRLALARLVEAATWGMQRVAALDESS